MKSQIKILFNVNIYYKTTSNNEKILIEFNNPNNLYGLFKNSSAIYIDIK